MNKIIANELLDYFCKKNHVVDGDGLLIVDEKLFGDDEERDINFHYGDGFAISEDRQYCLTYPKIKELTRVQKLHMQVYQGIPAPRSYTKRDCALCFGKIKKLA